MKVFYWLSDYISHRNAGLANMHAMRSLDCLFVSDPKEADVVILHEEPWLYARIFSRFPFLRTRHVIGYVVWEADILADPLRENLGFVDEIWTCSRFCAGILSGQGKKVSVIPHVVRAAKASNNAMMRVRNRIPRGRESYRFYTITKGDDPRKNVDAGVAAFLACAECTDAVFIVKTQTPINQRLLADRRVINLHGNWSERDISALHNLGDCFVSPHCSEGWGLALSEAMAHGNPVVATGYGGNMDFMSEENSIPVAYELRAIKQEHVRLAPATWSTEMRWAYVDQDDLSQKMGRCMTGKDAIRPLCEQARRDMRNFSPEVVGRLIGERLNAISI